MHGSHIRVRRLRCARPCRGLAPGLVVLAALATAVAPAQGPAGGWGVGGGAAGGSRGFHLVAAGDIMLDRAVGRAIVRNGYASILGRVRDRLRAADIAFCNLESPLSSRGAHDPHNCVFRADPSTVRVLLDGGFRVVSVANNHTMNSGRRTLMDTLDTLDRKGIKYAGARRDRATSWWPTVLQASGLRVGFMAFTDLSFEDYSYNKVGGDLSKFRGRIAAVARKVDVLVVSFHWGEEYLPVPTARQRRVARAAVDAGAGLILGHHPHVLEGMTAYRGVPILYSMGNFVFDQKQGERMESALFDLWYSEGGDWRVRATPVVIPAGRFGPVPATGDAARRIARRLLERSARVGSHPTRAADNTVTLTVAPARPPAAAATRRSSP